MASTSESGFGAILLRGQNLLTYILSFTNYAPPRQQEEASNFDTFLKTVIAANTTEIKVRTAYNLATTTRSAMFYKDTVSVVKLGTVIRGVISAQYGKKSIEFKQIDTAISKLKAGKVIRISVVGSPDAKKISQSEMSYGSLTQAFSNVVSTLETFNSYNPSRVELQLPQLKTFVTTLATLNNTVAANFQALKVAKDNRRLLYTELSERATRIKDYVKGTYGTQSQEYKMIKGLKI